MNDNNKLSTNDNYALQMTIMKTIMETCLCQNDGLQMKIIFANNNYKQHSIRL